MTAPMSEGPGTGRRLRRGRPMPRRGRRHFSGRRSVTGSRIELGDVLLEVENLKKHFPMKSKGIIRRATDPVKAVDGISFELRKGETLGLVGESGCGKSTAGRTILQLLVPTAGTIRYKGRDITGAKTADLRRLRTEMQMVFQDPYGSLNPRQSVGAIIGAPFAIQRIEPEGGVKAEVQRAHAAGRPQPGALQPLPPRVLRRSAPAHRHRPGLALRPSLIVCDEPVSALDVSIQAQVVNLLEDVQNEFGLTFIFIAHDLSVVRHISDRVAVMYLGKIMEIADRDELYANPLHPYTQALLSAVPLPDPRKEHKRSRILLKGDLPSPVNPPSGCVFHTRCPKFRKELTEEEKKRCVSEIPLQISHGPDHEVACHYAAPASFEVL